ncbi:MAG: hypothetical protein OEN50_14195 [Deltaproteobacteria bacterium]|nr:hypothetical protein [Deltaproteobacteria bacterium]
MMNCREYRELIAAHVAGALGAEEMPSAGSHLTDCVPCRELFEWESKAAQALKVKIPVISPPPGAKERLLERLEKQQGFTHVSSWIPLRPRVAGSSALVAFILFALWMLLYNSEDNFLSHAVAQHEKSVAQGPESSSRVSEPPRAARRLNLTLLGYEVADDRIDEMRGRERRLSVFSKDGNELVLAQEFEGVEMTPPANARRIRVKKREFVAFSQGRVNLVAWKDNGALCVLTSELPPDKLIHVAEHVAGRS